MKQLEMNATLSKNCNFLKKSCMLEEYYIFSPLIHCKFLLQETGSVEVWEAHVLHVMFGTSRGTDHSHVKIGISSYFPDFSLQ